MNKIGISIRTNKGEFKDFNTVLEQFMGKVKSGSVNQVEMLGAVQALAGTRQKESLLALVENMDALKQHQQDMATATGSAKKAFDDVYSNSLDAKVNDLKRSFEGLYEKILSSDSLKWLITEATQLVTALSNIDGKTIAFIATIGGLVLVMSKLAKINKELLALKSIDEAMGLTKLLGLATGIGVFEGEVTGLGVAFGSLKAGIASATESAIAFMVTPLGLTLGALSVVLGLVVGGFVAYEQHEKALTEQSKSLKTALDGVNESLKNGDTKGASENLDKIKKEQDEYKKIIDLKKDYQDKLANASETKIVGQYGLTEAEQYRQMINGLDKQLTEHKKVLADAGISEEVFAEAQAKIVNQNIVDKIKAETKAQVEHRENVEANTEEYKKYISTVQDLYSQYQNLSSKENLSAEQKIQLASVVEQLQGKIGNLNTEMDSSGKVYITNTGLISDSISYYNKEGNSVEVLTQIKLSNAKNSAEWEYNNTKITYEQTLQRINDYKAEINAIKELMSARINSAQSEINNIPQNDSNSDLKQSQIEHMALHGNQIDNSKINSVNEQINKLQAGKDAIDKLYNSMTIPNGNASNLSAPSNGDYMPSGGDSSEKKKAEKELEDSEKKMIDDITDAYNKAKDIISNDIEEIDAKITDLGEADNSNFVKRVDYTTDKIKAQAKEVDLANEQLMSLGNITVTTAEAQESLENATLKASKELRTQKLEATKLTQELQKTLQAQEKLVIEQEKNVAEGILDANQKEKTKQLEDLTTATETAHQATLDSYEAELKALEKENDEKEKSNELTEKKLALAEAEAQLARDEKQRSVQTLVEQKDGSFQYQYVLDQKTVNDDKKAVTDAKKDLADTKAKQELEDAKAVIEAKKTAEDELYKKQQKILKQHSDDIKEEQEREKKTLDTYYSDIEKLAKDRLAELSQQYGDNWDAIAKTIETKLKETQAKFTAMTTIQNTWGDKGLQEALKDGDGLDNFNNYIIKNKNNITKNSNTDISEIAKEIQNIKDAQNDVKNNTIESDDIISYTSDSKNSISKVVESDLASLKSQFTTLQDTNKSIEDEYDAHYKKLADKQMVAQNDQQTSLKNFAETYSKFTDKFLELVQMVYDYRFTNIVSIGKASTDLIMQALIICEESFEKITEIWNKTHAEEDWISNIDISSIVADMDAFKKSVSDNISNKASLYDNNNNPLYSESARSKYVDTSAYANQSAYTLGNSNLLSPISTNTTNNNSNEKTIYQTTVQNVNVNADNAKEFFNSVVDMVDSITNLSK